MMRHCLRLTVGFVGLSLFFWMILLVQKGVFLCFNFHALRASGSHAIADSLWRGLRFEGAALALLLSPALFLFWAAAATGWPAMRRLLFVYGVGLSLVISLITLADLQYFAETGAHLTYEATSYLNLSMVPIVAGAFALHPYLSLTSLLMCMCLVWLTAHVMKRLIRFSLSAPGGRALVASMLAFPVWIPLMIVAGRGGTQGEALRIGHCRISTSPYVNGLCLDPMFSVLWSSLEPSSPEYQFYDEESNVRAVRRLLLEDERETLSHEYPLLRRSPGTERGNRKNVVLFVLESWTARHVGALGGRSDTTPFFDGLAREGALFDQFFANGLRTPEGIFSILCSFPNQPLRRILGRASSYLVRWRTLSEILAEVGYDTIFMHGRDLEFDQMSSFLKASRFERIIDRRSFPPSAPRRGGTWPGYDDEEVMRHAHREFARTDGRPFLGVIYTMNTHEPFMTPEGYPLLFAPANDVNRFLNALNYSDYTLKVFFDLARKAPYFDNTIFVLVADHSRTGDTFNLANQHHIPFMIYAPGIVAAGRQHVVGSQLDIVPTVLGLLELRTLHASWGQDLLRIPADRGFAVSVAGGQIRWRDHRHLVDDGLTGARPLLCEPPVDAACRADTWRESTAIGETLKARLRAYLSLSQTLMYRDRVYPRRAIRAFEDQRVRGEPVGNAPQW